MIYWKKGFYRTPVEDGVAITDSEWLSLIEGQSQGLEIVEDATGRPVLQEYQPTIDEVRAAKLDEITAYDSSAAVNELTIDGVSLWLDKQARNSMASMLDAEQAAGATTTTIWGGGEPPMAVELPIDFARSMLAQLELYAKATYDTTQRHRAAVYGYTTIGEIRSYDHTVGYPSKLVLRSV